MSYLVLARKYRPQTFGQLVGQEHISKSFNEAMAANRIGHAFLFCGPRGIGKTSSARILAKSLNCLEGPTKYPCGKCEACLAITQGQSFDVIEIDAASNRGIDEIRTLRENVKFAPSASRYKIYIIDEVHMLTTEAFNALLKTLEEPPTHVKFILATTESHKIPATILSRCQRFDFKRIAVEQIMSNLTRICELEKITIEQEALFAIAKASQGSMRDALSILDQLSSFGTQIVKAHDVYGMLGLVELDMMLSLSGALIDRDCVKAIEVFNQFIDKGKDIRQLGRDLTEYFRHLMIIKVGGPALNELIDLPKLVKQRLAEQAQKTSIEFIVKSLDAFIGAQDTARIMENWTIPFEIAFAKLSITPKPSSDLMINQPQVKESGPIKQQAIPTVLKSASPATSTNKNIVDEKKIEPLIPEEKILSGNVSIEQIQKNWSALTHDISQKKMSLGSYLLEAAPIALNGQTLILGFPQGQDFAKEMVEKKENTQLIEQAFSQKLGQNVSIQWRIVDKMPKKEVDTEVTKALETFGGTVIQEWHNE